MDIDGLLKGISSYSAKNTGMCFQILMGFIQLNKNMKPHIYIYIYALITDNNKKILVKNIYKIKAALMFVPK